MMSNTEGNQDNLTSYTPQWHSQPTQTIRVPVALADAILHLSHEIDNSLSQVDDWEGLTIHCFISGDFWGVERTLGLE